MNTDPDNLFLRLARYGMRTLTDWLPYIIDVLVWVALAFLIISSFTEFVRSESFTDIAPTFFSAIALVVGLTSVTFTYSMTKTSGSQEQADLVTAGEMFFYALLIILITLLMGWFTFQVNTMVESFSWGGYLKIVLGIILLFSQLSLIVAATNLSRGIRILEHSLTKGKVSTVIRRRPRRK